MIPLWKVFLIMSYFHSILRVQIIGVSFFNKFVKWHHKLGYSVINVLKLIDITSRNASGFKMNLSTALYAAAKPCFCICN